MITLFHRPKTRSSRFIFLLEELEAPYQIKVVTTRTRDGTGTVDPANPHPHGKVPTISDDGVIVFESPAIAIYLTDKFPKNHLGPLVGEPERGAYLSWLCYYTGVLEPAFTSKFMNVEVPRGTAGWVAVEEAMPAVIDALSKGPYMLGERFSAADVLYATTFAMFGQS
ncbi:MAG: glutathione S-transferase family protein, partial [Rhodoferax sp.]